MLGREGAGARLQTMTILLAVLCLTAPDEIQEVKPPHVAWQGLSWIKAHAMCQEDLQIAKSSQQASVFLRTSLEGCWPFGMSV